MIGALYRYMREADPAHFQPMNANFGLVDDLPEPIRDKKRKREMIAERALDAMGEWRERIVTGPESKPAYASAGR
jgi:methylenetetrahydrofolate--tRNA-(uracil-5-)-methyltransferase